MKACIIPTKVLEPEFKPITIQLEINSKRELSNLLARIHVHHFVINNVPSIKHNTGFIADDISSKEFYEVLLKALNELKQGE